MALAALWWLSASLTHGATGAVLTLAPASQNVAVGDTVQIDLKLENVANLAAFETQLQFDESVLEFTSAERTDFLSSTGRSPSCQQPVMGPLPVIDQPFDTGGFVLWGCGSNQLSVPGATGSAIVATYKFKALAPGISNLLVRKLELANPRGDNCCGVLTFNQAVVQVGAPGAATPTALAPTATTAPAQATPVHPNGAPTPDPDLVLSNQTSRTAAPTPDSLLGSSASSSGTSGGGAGTSEGEDGATVGGGVAGATSSGGGAAGANSSGRRDSNGFPISGYGPEPSNGARRRARLVAASCLLVGLLFVGMGATKLRRPWPPG
jgi:hypothetical protein